MVSLSRSGSIYVLGAMSRILVSGLINIEITHKVDGFPLPFFLVRYPFHGISSSVSKFDYNIAKSTSNAG